MEAIDIKNPVARPSVARPLKAGLLMAFFTTFPIGIGTTGQGTELGLSLSYDIVKLHNGRIEVESWEGAGTEFIIQLPIV